MIPALRSGPSLIEQNVFSACAGIGRGLGRFNGNAAKFRPSFHAQFTDAGSGAVNVGLGLGSGVATFTRATLGWTRNSAGARVQVASGTARSYYLANGQYAGYLSEGARTNHFLNSDAPVTQTSPSLATGTYTLWMEGSGSIAVAQTTATITGAGTATAGVPVTFVVTVLGTVTYTCSGSVTFGQAENGAFASSWIVTAGASVTRNADVLTYVFAGNMDASNGGAYAELTTQWTTAAATSQALSTDTNTGRLLYVPGGAASTVISVTDGTTVVSKTSITDMATGIRKRASSWGGGQRITGDGGTATTGIFAGTIGNSAIGVGCSASGAGQWFGTVKNVRIWLTRLPESLLQTLTA